MRKTKLLSAFLSGTMAFSALGASFTSYAAGNEGKVLNIYCWNEEFKGIFENYAADITGDAGVKVNWVINETMDGLYQTELDNALENAASYDADDRADIFLVEPDYSDRYLDAGYAIPVSKLGLTAKDMKYQYNYTKEIPSVNGKVTGVTWNNCSGVFVYRRSIAKKVLGTDDPSQVQNYVRNWKSFDKTAAKMKKSGYYMLAGLNDTFRLFSQNSKNPWVKNNKLKIKTELNNWLTQAQKYYKKGYTSGAGMWSDEYTTQMSGDGETFGFFWPQWGVDYILGMAAQDTVAYGDYAVCEGPAPYYWGGTYICAANCTDNKTIIAKIMKRLTCNTGTMYNMAKDGIGCVNNTAVMKKLAKDSDMKSELLGGQNPYLIYHKNALKVSGKNVTQYDLILDDDFSALMDMYITGETSKKEALDTFYDYAANYFPELYV